MKFILADDHELVRVGLRLILEELSDHVEVVEARDYAGALVVAEQGASADLAILDLHMAGEGVEGLKNFRFALPDVPVAVLSGSNDFREVVGALQAGVRGFLPKVFGSAAMAAAIRLILAGERFFPDFAFDALLKRLPASPMQEPTTGDRPADSLLARLSVRENDILEHMIEGGTNKEIARTLGVQEITVKVHLRNIYRKLGAVNRAQAVRIALENGWRDGGKSDA